MYEILGAEPFLGEEYPSNVEVDRLFGRQRSTSRFEDTTVIPDSSSKLGDTVVLSSKSPLIMILECS